MLWTARVNRGSAFRAWGKAAVATGVLGRGWVVGAGAGVAGCFVALAVAAGLSICSGSGSVAAGGAAVGEGLGSGVSVAVEVLVGEIVGVAESAGVGALEQAQDARKPASTSANARNFPSDNVEPRTYRLSAVNWSSSCAFIRTM